MEKDNVRLARQAEAVMRSTARAAARGDYAVQVVLACVLLLSACGTSAPVADEAGEDLPCFVYKGLSEEEIRRMEARCDAYAACSDEAGGKCSPATGEATE